MAWIQSLELETIFINIFSGSQDIFVAVAMFFIFGMAGYFRMNGIAMFFMFTVFLVMFHAYVASYMLLIIGMIGGLLAGLFISQLVKR